jgi:hypothetical protein
MRASAYLSKSSSRAFLMGKDQQITADAKPADESVMHSQNRKIMLAKTQ